MDRVIQVRPPNVRAALEAAIHLTLRDPIEDKINRFATVTLVARGNVRLYERVLKCESIQVVSPMARSWVRVPVDDSR